MSMKTELEDALKEAMRSSDVVRRGTLRMVLSAVKEAEIQKKGELDDPTVLSLLQKEVKSRQESIADAEKAGRPDLVEAAKTEMAILEEYLPKQLSDAELDALVTAAIAESGASSAAEMGQVMKVLLPKIQGRADGGRVSQAVRGRLQGG
jgi:uncharacterized protein YqeY